jgi:hypothetical protein
VRDIRESEATSKFIAKVLTQRDGDDTAAKAFAKYQASGEGDNPLADIKIPDQVVALAQAAPPDAMKNKEATRLITAGDFTGALTAAKAYLATLPPDKNDAGVYGVGDVIRSKYENTVLATDYLADHENTPVSF